LNIYGFKRVLKGTLVGAYFNASFQRGQPDLLGNIKRTVATRSRSMGSIDGGSQDALDNNNNSAIPPVPGKRKRRNSTINPATAELEEEMQLWSASLDTGMDDMLSESNTMFPPFPFISKSATTSNSSSNLLHDSSMDNTSLIASGDSDFRKATRVPKLSLSLPAGLTKEIKESKTVLSNNKKQQKVLSQLQKTIAMYGHLSSAFVSPRELNGTSHFSSAAYTPTGAVSSSESHAGLVEHDSPLSLDFNANSVLCMADVASPSSNKNNGGSDSPPKSARGRPPRIRKPKVFDDATYSPSNAELSPRGHSLHRPVPTVPRTPGGREVLVEDLTEISIDPFVLAQYGEIYYMPPEGGKAIRIKANYISDHSSRAPLRSVSSENPIETPSSPSLKRSSPNKKTNNSTNSSSSSFFATAGKKSSSSSSSSLLPSESSLFLDQSGQRTDPELLDNLAMGVYGRDHHTDMHMDFHEYPLAPTPLLSLLPSIGDMSHTHEIPFETIFADPNPSFSH